MRLHDVVGVFLAATAAACAPLAAQTPVTLRYAPRVGALVRTVTRSDGRISYRELDEAAQPVGDSVVGEMTSLSGITRRILEGTDSTRAVEVSYDSLKTRARLLGQAWKESALSDADKVALTLTLDEQLHTVAGGSGGLAADPVANGGIASWRGVPLPGHPISLGAVWAVQTVYRLPTQLGDLLDLSVRDSIMANAIVKLDSVVLQTHDTLMYLTVRESFGPVTLPATDAGEPATAHVAGSQAASLVWSTAWNAFVSGASRARVVARLVSTSESGNVRKGQVTWNVTTRLQVRL
jgi:hypothetical protein